MHYMRPDRGIVKQAIVDAKGSITKAAIILGCSRPTLYTWIYQLGLEREAGIRIDNKSEVYNNGRKDNTDRSARNQDRQLLSHGPGGRPMLRAVGSNTATAPPEIMQATMRLRADLWRRVRIRAIRDNLRLSDFVEKALEQALIDESVAGQRAKKRGEE